MKSWEKFVVLYLKFKPQFKRFLRKLVLRLDEEDKSLKTIKYYDDLLRSYVNCLVFVEVYTVVL